MRVIAEQFPTARDRDRFRLLVRTIEYVHGAPLERESRRFVLDGWARSGAPMCDRRADVRVSADAGLKPASSDGAMLRAATIVNGSTVCCVQSYQGNAMPLVNAASSRRMILRMMRRERHRGSQLNRRADEPLSVVVHQSAMFGVALDAVPCGRWPNARSVGPGGERRECHAALT